jgi:hypothetical protein
MVFHLWIYCTLIRLTSFITLPYHFPHIPYFSTAFNAFCYDFFLYKYNVFLYYSLSIPLFSSSSSPSTLKHSKHSICACIMIILYLCICLSFGFVSHIWKKTCNPCFSEPGLHHLTRYPEVYSFTRKQYNFILLYGWTILHCVYVPHFLNPFISCRASGLFP